MSGLESDQQGGMFAIGSRAPQGRLSVVSLPTRIEILCLCGSGAPLDTCTYLGAECPDSFRAPLRLHLLHRKHNFPWELSAPSLFERKTQGVLLVFCQTQA